MNGLGLMTVTRSQNPGALACGTTVSRRIWRLPGAANTHAVFFQSQRNLRKVLDKIRQTDNRFACCYGKLAIDRASIVFGKKIGRFSFQIGRSGDFHYFIKNREISRKIGRLGSYARLFFRYLSATSYDNIDYCFT